MTVVPNGKEQAVSDKGPDQPNRDRKRKLSANLQQEQRRTRLFRNLFWIVIVAAALYSLYGFPQGPQPKDIAYTQFITDVRAGRVAEVTMQGRSLTGSYREGEKAAAQPRTQAAQKFKTALPPIDDQRLIPLLEDKGVTVNVQPEEQSWWLQLLIGFLPWMLLLGLIFYANRRMQEQMAGGGPGGIFQFTKSKAKRYRKGASEVTFDDVAGLGSAKRDLKQITEYLKEPRRYQELGAKLPRGVLLVGAPGTGKTLLAKAAAGEASVPFYSISGSEFIEMLVGVGASRVRDLFENAKKEAPAIIFIDEIDSVGRSRGTGLGGGHDEREQTLNQILSEMDGFSPEHSVVVLAATNRPDVLDPALLRPGRFDRKIQLDLPQKEARQKILEIHSRNVRLSGEVDLAAVARRTAGFSGADLENLINEAALLAGREGLSEIGMQTLNQARDKIVMGVKRELVLDEEGKRRIAYHESGHALLTCLLPNTDPLDKVTIIPRGHALGATQQSPDERRLNLPESYLKDRITVALGGRAAEKLVFGETSSGAEDDLSQVTKTARRMVSRWGMNERLGAVAFRRDEEHVFLGREMAQPRDFSEHTARLIDDEVRRIVGELEEKTGELLRRHRDQLDSIAEALLEKESLQADEVRALAEPEMAAAGR